MSATTYITRQEELSYDNNSRLVQMTDIFVTDGGEFASNIATLMSADRQLTDLNTLLAFAEDEENEELVAIINEEMKRDNLDSTDYEVFISY